jgi:hypothetical protein
MLPTTKLYFMQDVKGDKVNKPSLWWPIVEGVFTVMGILVIGALLVFLQDIVLFIRSVI